MGRKKRSLKLAERAEQAVKPILVPIETAKPVGEFFGALCPVCGRWLPSDRALKVGNTTIGRVGYFDSIEWDKDKPFGVAFQAGGRGSLNNWRYIGPEEDSELFEALKGRLLQAVKEWREKGWLSDEDISSISHF